MLSPIRQSNACLIVWLICALSPCAVAALEFDPPSTKRGESWPARQVQFVEQEDTTSPSEDLPNFDDQITPAFISERELGDLDTSKEPHRGQPLTALDLGGLAQRVA